MNKTIDFMGNLESKIKIGDIIILHCNRYKKTHEREDDIFAQIDAAGFVREIRNMGIVNGVVLDIYEQGEERPYWNFNYGRKFFPAEYFRKYDVLQRPEKIGASMGDIQIGDLLYLENEIIEQKREAFGCSGDIKIKISAVGFVAKKEISGIELDIFASYGIGPHKAVQQIIECIQKSYKKNEEQSTLFFLEKYIKKISVIKKI